METQCSHCNKSFDTYPYKIKKHKNLFCSTICQYAFKKNNNTLICRICGNSFQVANYRIKNQKECFCSKKCADQALIIPKLKTNCKTCGIEFEFLESRLKHSNRGYCSLPCFYEGKRNSIERSCENCKASFSSTPSEIKDGRGRFCSRKCYTEFCVNEKSPSFKHGHFISKKHARSRSNICEICKNAGKTEIHHIDGNDRNNTIGNFITVCRKCHTNVHHTSGRHSIPMEKALEIFKVIRYLPKKDRWAVAEKLKLV